MSTKTIRTNCCGLWFAGLLLLLDPGSGFASSAKVETAGAVSCAIAAWSTDKDPEGLNVRAAPHAGAPVVGKLPPPRELDGEAIAVEVRIVGARNGWFLIDRAEFADYGDPQQPEVVFGGRGWVSGHLLSLGVGGRTIQAAPSETARKLADLVGEDRDGNAYGPDVFNVERLHACRGEWAEVEGILVGPGSRHRGWVRGVCSNQVTTCS